MSSSSAKAADARFPATRALLSGALPKGARARAALAVVAAGAIGAAGWLAFASGGGELGRGAGREGAAVAEPAARIARERDELVVTAAKLMPLDAERAIEVNAAIPLAAPGPGARPFFAGRGQVADTALACLARAVYYEAASEPIAGQRAVAQVVLNRARHPAYPNSVCAVVYQGSERRTGCQFTFTCDGSLHRRPLSSLYRQSEQVAREALAGHVEREVGWATHYHADYVVPYWAKRLSKVAVLGRHIFYRWADGWSNPAAFRRAYSGVEVDPASAAGAALAEVALDAVSPPGAGEAKAPAVRLRDDDLPKLAAPRSGQLAIDATVAELKPELAAAPKLRIDEELSGQIGR